jgi:hypothetical protein
MADWRLPFAKCNQYRHGAWREGHASGACLEGLSSQRVERTDSRGDHHVVFLGERTYRFCLIARFMG